jgi:lipopolysaccharide transport system ATP-binding protein
MSSPVIIVKGLSKLYRIGGKQERYKTLRESIMSAVTRRLKSLRSSPSADFIWALKDVSFEVQQGDVVGIIGRNGAGKTTLLKILSRITEPTEGYAKINGRVRSLLEVGTGFHPELTGRENIYLNGAILGMKRAEIDRQFDEIVTFAEIEKFLDTPVKRYSSGMYVRLAFAVAAHMEQEILLVDEVLAVGDYEFQKKCLGKIGDISRKGRTVLLISHNMPSILNLCKRAVLLHQGEIIESGLAKDVVASYIALGREGGGEVLWSDPRTAPGNDRVRLHAVRIVCDGEVTADVDIHKDVQIHVEFWNIKPGSRLTASIHLKDSLGGYVLASANMPSANLGTDPWFDRPYPEGLFRTVCCIPGNFLNEGLYWINAIVLNNVTRWEAHCDDAISFTVHDTGTMRREYGGKWIGVVRPRLAWNTEYLAPLDNVG